MESENLKPNALPLEDKIDVLMDIDENDKVIKIKKCLNDEEQEDTTALLHDFPKIFAWKYCDMPWIDQKIMMHNIVLDNNVKPIHRKICKIHPKVALLVKEELEKLLDTCFIWPIDYSPRISNIVTVAKLDNKIRMCTKFLDWNKASLKDDFPLPNINMIMD